MEAKDVLYYYKAKLVSLYDADTMTVDIDLGFGMWMKNQKVRLARINAWEVTRRKGVTAEEKVKGIKARDWLRQKFIDEIGLNIVIASKSKNFRGKYGRIIVEVFYEIMTNKLINLNDELVRHKHARRVKY